MINAVTVKMSTNYLVSVPKLKGRENYSEWAFAAENFLVLEGMSDCIKSETIPAEIGAAGDAKTKAKLILTIDSSLYVHIKGVQTTHELWKKLKNLFDDTGFTRRISLLRSLISIRLENSASMTSYVTQIIETSQKLCGTGFNINDEWVASLLLAGLTEKYSPMIMAIEHCGIPLTADAIKTKLLDMEESGNGGDSSASNSSGAFASYKKNRNVGSTATKDNTQMSKSKPKTITCYKCKQTGHYRNQCTSMSKNSSNTNKTEKATSNAFSAVFLNGEFSKSDWYIDSGASVHLTANEEWLTNVSRDLKVKEIVVANKDKVPVLCTGDVQITTKTHACEYDITVEGVLCVPKLTTNLLSVSQLISKGNKVSFNSYGCQVFNQAGVLVATASLLNGVYKLNMSENCSLAAVMVSSEVWHRRLGHVNSQYLNKMQDAVQGLTLDSKSDISKSSCVTCCEGKQSRLPFPKEGSRSTELLHIVHTDLCGPMENQSIGGSKYFMLFIDDFSRMTYIYFLKTKDEALKCFQQYKAEVENQLNCSIKILRSDNGTEFCNSAFENYLVSHGIVHHKTNPYTPEQNGLSERFNRSVIEKAKCLLFDAGLEKRFWAEAAHTAVYLQNRTVTASLNYKTPFELWTGRKPDVSHLRVFGSTVMVHVPKQKRLKWDRKSDKCILVGYSNEVKGYRIYNPKCDVITTSRDVIVLEKIETENVQEVQKNCSDEVSVVPVGEQDLTLMEDSIEQPESLNADDSGELYVPCENDTLDSSESSTTDSEDSIILNNVNMTSGPRRRQQPDRYGFASGCIEDDNMFTGEISLQEALVGPEKAQWLMAVQDELLSFEKNSAWELVDVPVNGTIVQCKWVLRKKYDSDNKVRYRARLVAKGFTQKHGVDYTETFSPVVRHTTLRLLFALSVKLGLEVSHLDVKTAFLNGDLEETIYMKMPECYKSSSAGCKVLKLKKAIYGLKQASRAWNKKVDNCLISNGYKRSKIEPCMYIKDTNKCKTIVTVYVDDFFIFSNDKIETENLKQVLSNQFSIKDLGQVKVCLGMNITFNKDKEYVTLSQETYIDQLLNKFNLSDCKTADTPMEVKLNVNKGQDSINSDVPYQQLIGSLMYLSVLTRPDISYSISFLSQFNNCHTKELWEYAKRVLKYLKRTKSYGIKYCKAGNSEITGYVDADWASNSIDRRSYTGMCFMLCDGVISWECKKQKCVALSSTESEYVGLSEACREAMYLKELQYEITNKMYTISLFNDNQGAQKLCANPVFHKRTKHIDIKYHFCRDAVKDKIVKVLYLPTADMPADILTKSLCSAKHYRFMSLLGIVCLK